MRVFKNPSPGRIIAKPYHQASKQTKHSPLPEVGEGSGVGSKSDFLDTLIERPYFVIAMLP